MSKISGDICHFEPEPNATNYFQQAMAEIGFHRHTLRPKYISSTISG